MHEAMMAAENFDKCILWLKVHEGGYTNHPKDPGGPTKYGITLIDYRKYIKRKATWRDVYNMQWSTAKKIYKLKYWDRCRCDDLPAGIDYCVFDYGVNSGTGRPRKVLRRLVGQSTRTVTITDEVLAAVRKRYTADVIHHMCDERMTFLRRLSIWDTFGRGWTRRVRDVRRRSIELATNAQPMADPLGAEPNVGGKGEIPKPKSTQPTIVGTATVATSAATYVDPQWVIVFVLLAIIIGIGANYLVNYIRRKRQETPMPIMPLPEVTTPTLEDVR